MEHAQGTQRCAGKTNSRAGSREARSGLIGPVPRRTILLTAETLKSLIQQGETVAVEFKGEEAGSLSGRDLVEAVVCLANRSGEGFGINGGGKVGHVVGSIVDRLRRWKTVPPAVFYLDD